MIVGSWPMARIHAGTGAAAAPGRQRGCPRTWLVLAPLARVGVRAALAGVGEATSTTETLSEQAAISSAQAAVLSRWPGRGVSHSRAAPAR